MRRLLRAAGPSAIEARLFFLQVIDHADLMARADRQQLRTLNPPAKRGEIVDRNGRVLAYSVDADTIAADPSEIDDPDDVARQICGALDGCTADRRADMAKKLRRKGAFVYLVRQMSPEEAAARARAAAARASRFSKRAAATIPKQRARGARARLRRPGQRRLGGIESAYDAQIRGRDGKVLIQTDARRHALSSRVERPATAGAGIELTIDQYLQYVAERELRAAWRRTTVDDRVIVPALHHVLEVVLHVVAQVVEAELVVGAVGHVGGVGLAALRRIETVHDDADGEAEEAGRRAPIHSESRRAR